MKNFQIKWLSYSVSGIDKADGLRRAKEFVKRNLDDLIVDVDEREPKRGVLSRLIFG